MNLKETNGDIKLKTLLKDVAVKIDPKKSVELTAKGKEALAISLKK